MKIANNVEDIEKMAENVPRILMKDVKILYTNDVWDGPLEGVLQWGEKKYYFICYNDPTHEHEVEREYAIIEMTEDQAATEAHFHQLFVEHVGHHYEYGDNGKPNSIPVSKSKEEQQKFYSEYEKAEKYTITPDQVKAKF